MYKSFQQIHLWHNQIFNSTSENKWNGVQIYFLRHLLVPWFYWGCISKQHEGFYGLCRVTECIVPYTVILIQVHKSKVKHVLIAVVVPVGTGKYWDHNWQMDALDKQILCKYIMQRSENNSLIRKSQKTLKTHFILCMIFNQILS